ncbi:MAG: hypothetical protein ACRD6X_02675 [Pyrinomonadaceae bacterium]
MQARYIFFVIAVVAAIGGCSVVFPEGVGAIVMLCVCISIAIFVIRRNTEDTDFVMRLFVFALLIRVLFGTIIYVFQLSDFFGPDAITYDFRAGYIADHWSGTIGPVNVPLQRWLSISGSGWGMHYLVAAIYFIFGKNALAAQALCWVVGASIGPAVYICSQLIYKNSQVAKFAGLMTAFFPAFIIWSSQLLKDGLIIFLLVVAIIAVFRLHEKFNAASVLVLVFAMFGILSLRFYIFYMVAIAAVGSFIIGLNNNPGSILRRTVILILVGFGLTYLGVLRTAKLDFEQFGNLESIQRSRDDLARSGESGFGEDLDVSTTEGALTAIPVGFVNLMFAPFPWQVTNFRQAVALPETLLWWAMMPLMIAGIIYTIRHRLREALPILLFSLMLTLAYSIFQGNVGTAYRQRTQIQVFLFMFIAVGWILRKEAKENKQIEAQAARQQMDAAAELT